MDNAKDAFFDVSSKLETLRSILDRHRQIDTDGPNESLTRLTEFMDHVTTSINTHTDKDGGWRLSRNRQDTKKAEKILRSLETEINFHTLDINMTIDNHIKRLEMKVDDLADDIQLNKLCHVMEAGWIAQREDKCLTGTRCMLMSDLLNWCNDVNGSRVFWLSGMAGTGKSAVARTLCDHLSGANLLGGSFFCSRRGTVEQQNIARIIPTLARQLARLDPQYRRNIIERLKLDSDIAGATVNRQLEQLFVKSRSEALSALSTPLILVIDGLDEGAKADEVARLLEAILGNAEDMPFRFVLTSRPESHIREAFSQSSSWSRTILHLDQIEESMIKADIQLYVMYRLQKIKNLNKNLPKEWPTPEQVRKLADRADKLFMFASMACDYIKRDPLTRLDIVTRATINDEQLLMRRLDEIYTSVLDEAMNSEDAESDSIVSNIGKCLTVLAYAKETPTITSIAIVMETSPRRVRVVMDNLHSLILIPESSDDVPVTALHSSLCDYLTDGCRSRHHVITEDAVNWIHGRQEKNNVNV